MKKKKSFEIWQIKILSKSNKRRGNLVEEIRYLVKPNSFFEILNLEDVSINIGISSLKGYKYRYLYLFRELMPILIDVYQVKHFKESIQKKMLSFKFFSESNKTFVVWSVVFWHLEIRFFFLQFSQEYVDSSQRFFAWYQYR